MYSVVLFCARNEQCAQERTVRETYGVFRRLGRKVFYLLQHLLCHGVVLAAVAVLDVLMRQLALLGGHLVAIGARSTTRARALGEEGAEVRCVALIVGRLACELLEDLR